MSIERREFLAGLAAVGGATLLASAEAPAQPRKGRYAAPVIDAHAHYYSPEFVSLMIKEGGANGVVIKGPDKNGEYAAVVPNPAPGDDGYLWYSPNGSTFTRNMTDLDFMIQLMDGRGIDMYALSMTHPKVYWASPEFGLRLSQAQNDGVSAATLKYPKRFVGTIMLPMQSPKVAVQELERASKLPGMRAINLGEHINGTNLSDKSFWPVWERCEALGLPLFLHNINPFGHLRLNQGGIDMMNNIGNPFEATVASMAFILTGTLDAFPKLDIYLPHAGGALPWLVWRTDWAMANSNQYKNLKLPRASDYLRRFHYDLILHSPKLMRTLIELVGADRVVCGTDYPQGMAVMKPVEYVESIPGITQRERELILCENPARLLKI
jgi:aminocarboxymuconate-semialdehyde decarboxylase